MLVADTDVPLIEFFNNTFCCYSREPCSIQFDCPQVELHWVSKIARKYDAYVV